MNIEIIIMHSIVVIVVILFVIWNSNKNEKRLKRRISEIRKEATDDSKVSMSRKSRINQDILKMQRKTKDVKK